MKSHIHQEGDVMVVSYDGPLSYKARAATLDVVLPILREHGLRRILLDFTGAYPSREHLEAAEVFAEKLATVRSLKGAAIAFLNAPPGQSAPVELIAALGEYQVQRFFNRREAMAWLQDAVEPA